MGEIRGRLLIGGMVLRNLEASLDPGALDHDTTVTLIPAAVSGGA